MCRTFTFRNLFAPMPSEFHCKILAFKPSQPARHIGASADMTVLRMGCGAGPLTVTIIGVHRSGSGKVQKETMPGAVVSPRPAVLSEHVGVWRLRAREVVSVNVADPGKDPSGTNLVRSSMCRTQLNISGNVGECSRAMALFSGTSVTRT
jgi:hypothetical protein